MFDSIGHGGVSLKNGFLPACLAALVSVLPALPCRAAAEGSSPQQQLAFDIYKELIEINTVTATGDTARAVSPVAVTVLISISSL